MVGLGDAFFGALDLVCSHVDAQGEVGDAEAKDDPPSNTAFPKAGLADREPLRVVGLGF
ncbi:MAG TPA: hypothetical protein VGH77_16160 [Streptosporangiaceae bacterium]|jgi:hypothetical protein